MFLYGLCGKPFFFYFFSLYSEGVIPTIFYRKLKSIIGLTPVDFIREVRIKRAAQLIDSGEYNFSQVAYMTGFNDPKYFSRRFKKIMGVTPTEYKERKGDAS